MPNFEEIIEALPEEAKGIVKAAFLAANPLAGIDTKEKAAEYIGRNPLFKAASDDNNRKAINTHQEKFMAESFPKLAKAEADKREQEVMLRLKPDLDPVKALEIAMKKQAEDFAATLAERDKKEIFGNQRALALKIAASEGIPVDDIDRFIGEDDTKTTESVKAYAARVKAFADAKVEAALKERLGNNGSPRGGSTVPPADLKTQYDAASKAGNGIEMLRLKGLIQAANIQE